MKKTVVTFTCDSCGKEVILQNGNFPFDRGWFRLDDIKLTIPAPEKPTTYEQEYVDLCSMDCLFRKIMKEVENKGVQTNPQVQPSIQEQDNFRVEKRVIPEELNPDDRRRRML